MYCSKCHNKLIQHFGYVECRTCKYATSGGSGYEDPVLDALNKKDW